MIFYLFIIKISNTLLSDILKPLIIGYYLDMQVLDIEIKQSYACFIYFFCWGDNFDYKHIIFRDFLATKKYHNF